MRNTSPALALAFSAVFLCHSVPALAFSKMVVFGASTSDTGMDDPDSFYSRLATEGYDLPGAPYYRGRFSNGPVAVEYAAQALGIGLENYSVASATSGYYNLFADDPAVGATGGLSQLAAFTTSLGGGMADADALYVYWLGGNDLVGATPDDLQARIGTAMQNMDQSLQQLDALGARHIVVANRVARPELASVDNLNAVALNAAMASEVMRLDQALGADVRLFDAYGMVQQMMEHPALYNILEPTALCTWSTTCSDDLAVAEGYIHWDGGHVTTRVHRALGAGLVSVASEVPLGPAMGYFAAGLLLVSTAARRRV